MIKFTVLTDERGREHLMNIDQIVEIIHVKEPTIADLELASKEALDKTHEDAKKAKNYYFLSMDTVVI